MNTADLQIKKAYEQGMSPEEIAADQDLDVVAVKAKLMQVSSLYRKDCGKEPADQSVLNFSDDQLDRANQVIFEVMVSAQLPDGTPDYRTRLKAAEYIRDDKKGRKEVKQVMQNQTFNLLNFNEDLEKTKQVADKMRKMIDV